MLGDQISLEFRKCWELKNVGSTKTLGAQICWEYKMMGVQNCWELSQLSADCGLFIHNCDKNYPPVKTILFVGER